MATKNKNIEGQLFFDLSLTPTSEVVQANKLVFGKQSLKLNSAKLVRAAITQIDSKDTELKPYVISIKDLAELLNISSSNLYRDIEDITEDIMSNPVYVKETDGKKTRWVKIPWVSRCAYDSDIGISILLNEQLKPYLLNLKENSSSYTFDKILSMKSVYSSRLYELINSKIENNIIPLAETKAILTVQEIRESCSCEDKYKLFSNFIARVIEPSVQEINALTMYNITYNYIKAGKRVIALEFIIALGQH